MEHVLIERFRDLTPIPSREIGSVSGKDTTGARFAEVVSELIADVNQKQNVAEANAIGLAKGEVGIMDTVVALNEADLSLRMMMQIRDRVIDAYQRILRTL